jgi:hypothetical protein
LVIRQLEQPLPSRRVVCRCRPGRDSLECHP